MPRTPAPNRRKKVHKRSTRGKRKTKTNTNHVIPKGGNKSVWRECITGNCLERVLQQAVRNLAEYRGWLFFHDYDSRKNPPGFPDCVMVRREGCVVRLIFAELKTNSSKLRDSQLKWAALLTLVPCISYHVWRPSDWHDIIEKMW